MDSTRFQIRSARPAEHRCLSDIGIRAKAVWDYDEAMMAQFRKELTLSECYINENDVRVLTVERRIVAYSSLAQIGPRVIELAHLFVDPDYLRRGAGTALYDDALSRARANGNFSLVIQSDPNAVGFYERLGLRVTKSISSSIPGRSIPYFEHSLDLDVT